MTRIRLLKASIQLVFVEDDGETLSEIITETMTVTAAEWPNVVEQVEMQRAFSELQVNGEAS